MTPQIKKAGTETYDVIGASGERAGGLQKIGPKNNSAWLLTMVATPRETFRYFADAKADALDQAQRY